LRVQRTGATPERCSKKKSATIIQEPARTPFSHKSKYAFGQQKATKNSTPKRVIGPFCATHDEILLARAIVMLLQTNRFAMMNLGANFITAPSYPLQNIHH